jgi:hypothetical protein
VTRPESTRIGQLIAVGEGLAPVFCHRNQIRLNTLRAEGGTANV